MPHRLICVLGLVLLAAVTAPAGEFRISGPYTHDNLSVYLLHGAARDAGPRMITLREAMEQKKAIVHETGQVNQLSIENQSSEPLYIQSGDIVKGGRQDRVLVTDLVVPPKSGKVPIASFCVEQGRWTKRSGEAADQFNASANLVAGKQLKMAVKEKKAQTEVWNEVANAQTQIASASVPVQAGGAGVGPGVARGVAGGTPGGVMGGVVGGVPSAAPPPLMAMARLSTASASSMQLTLEHKVVVDATAAYRNALAKVIDGKDDVVGFAYAINGKVDSADAYASPDLFRRMWPKLLEASAVEALAARPRAKADTAAPAIDAVERMMSEAVPKGAKVALFESRRGDAWLHRSYVVK